MLHSLQRSRFNPRIHSVDRSESQKLLPSSILVVVHACHTYTHTYTHTTNIYMHKQKKLRRGWRDASAGENTCCSCRRPGFGYLKSCHGSQTPVTPVPGHSPSSSGFCGCQVRTWCKHICKMLIYKK